MTTVHFISHSPSETRRIARSLAEKSRGRIVFALHGELGSGKTCFVQGLAKALGVKQAVTSPTFTIINEYKGARHLYHIDLYRLRTPDEALAIGFEDYIEADAVTAVEWAERADDLVPADAVHVHFENTQDPDSRSIIVIRPEEP